jgi:hypothetical protein
VVVVALVLQLVERVGLLVAVFPVRQAVLVALD